jgi:hypothetical protein
VRSPDGPRGVPSAARAARGAAGSLEPANSGALAVSAEGRRKALVYRAGAGDLGAEDLPSCDLPYSSCSCLPRQAHKQRSCSIQQFFCVASTYMALRLDNLLKDKAVLYLVLFFAITNVIGYLILNNLEAVLLFVAVAFLTSYFTKNMIIVLLTALIATNVYAGAASHAKRAREGFAEPGKKGKKGKKKKKKSAGLPNAPQKESFNPDGPRPIDPQTDSETDEEDDGPPTGASAGLDQAEATGVAPKLNYAGTLEKAYDNLDKILGSGAIAAMGDDTAKLADKQSQLMGNIEKLDPLIQKAGKMLEGLQSGSGRLGGMISRVSGMVGGAKE